MPTIDSFLRFARRAATAPWLVEDTRAEVVVSRGAIDSLAGEFRAFSAAQLDAIALLTRAIDELNRRIERLERPHVTSE